MKHDRNDHDDRPVCTTQSICSIILFFAFIALCILGAMMSGCSRKVYLPVEHTIYRTDTLRVAQQRIDSIFVHDSIAYVQKGDSVFITKYRDQFRYILRTDTLFESKTDSIKVSEPYPIEVVKEVKKPLAWWQKTLMWIGVATLISLLAMIYIFIRKK